VPHACHKQRSPADNHRRFTHAVGCAPVADLGDRRRPKLLGMQGIKLEPQHHAGDAK
jgi:hypothetical protein